MKSRRKAIKKVISLISAMPFLSSKASACMDTWSGPSINISTSKKILKKFYVGNINEFLHREYKNIWTWNKDITVISGNNKEKLYYIERIDLAPINVSSSIKYNINKIYCSKIDILYSDKRSDGIYAIYSIASIKLYKNALPYYSTRIRMTSNRAKIYAALTFRNIETNEIIETKVSNLPANLKLLSCAPLNFWYTNA